MQCIPMKSILDQSNLISEDKRLLLDSTKIFNSIKKNFIQMLRCYATMIMIEPYDQWRFHVNYSSVFLICKDRFIHASGNIPPDRIRMSEMVKKYEDLFPFIDRICGAKELVMKPANTEEEIQERVSTPRSSPSITVSLRKKQQVEEWMQVSREIISMKELCRIILSDYNKIRCSPPTPRHGTYWEYDIEIVCQC